MTENRKDYMLGVSESEIIRLKFQNQVWRNETEQLWDEADFKPGETIVDLGCGPGFSTIELATRVTGKGNIYGIDLSEKYIEYLNRLAEGQGIINLRTLISDVHHPDMPDEIADGIFARWVLCFVKDPLTVLTEAFRLLKKGGRFAVMDYFNYKSAKIFPERKSFNRLFEGYYNSALLNKGTYDIGNTLPEMFAYCGFEISSLKPVCRIAGPNSDTWKWLELFNDAYIPELVKAGLLTNEEKDEFYFDWKNTVNNPYAFFFTPPIMAVVAVKV